MIILITKTHLTSNNNINISTHSFDWLKMWPELPFPVWCSCGDKVLQNYLTEGSYSVSFFFPSGKLIQWAFHKIYRDVTSLLYNHQYCTSITRAGSNFTTGTFSYAICVVVFTIRSVAWKIFLICARF